MQLTPVPILINGVSYHWADIQLSIAGSVPIAGITEINYGFTRKVENVYGAGSEPVTRGYGNKEYTASITMKLEEVQNLVNVASGGDITLIPTFNITVAWLDDELVTITNILRNCKFTNFDIKTKQNDTSTDITLNLVYAGLQQI